MDALTYATASRCEGTRRGYEDHGLKRDSKIWRKRMAAWAEQTDRAYMLALRTTGSPALAEEAVQEACVYILQNPPEDRGDEAAAAYFLKAVHGMAVSTLRSSKHRRQREENHGVAAEKNSHSPEEIAAATETARAARAALEGLSQEEREAICLCCEQSLTHRMAAYVLQEPEKTVTDRVQRGLEKLRRRLVAQGFAAATPIVLGQQLAELGVPKAPTGLASRVHELSAAARESVRAVRNAAGRSASGNLAVKVILGAAVAGAVAIVVLKPWQPTPAGSAPASKAAAQTEDEPLYFKWTFEQGPARELTEVEGSWQWKQLAKKAPGFMATEGNQWVAVTLPVTLPPRPLVLTLHLVEAGRPEQGEGYFMGSYWWDGSQPVARKLRGQWSVPARGKMPHRRVERIFLLDKYVIDCLDQGVLSVLEYDKAYPADRYRFGIKNWDVEAIELSSLRPSEIPAQFQDVEKLIQELDRRKKSGGDLTRIFEWSVPSGFPTPTGDNEEKERKQ